MQFRKLVPTYKVLFQSLHKPSYPTVFIFILILLLSYFEFLDSEERPVVASTNHSQNIATNATPPKSPELDFSSERFATAEIKSKLNSDLQIEIIKVNALINSIVEVADLEKAVSDLVKSNLEISAAYILENTIDGASSVQSVQISTQIRDQLSFTEQLFSKNNFNLPLTENNSPYFKPVIMSNHDPLLLMSQPIPIEKTKTDSVFSLVTVLDINYFVRSINRSDKTFHYFLFNEPIPIVFVNTLINSPKRVETLNLLLKTNTENPEKCTFQSETGTTDFTVVSTLNFAKLKLISEFSRAPMNPMIEDTQTKNKIGYFRLARNWMARNLLLFTPKIVLLGFLLLVCLISSFILLLNQISNRNFMTSNSTAKLQLPKNSESHNQLEYISEPSQDHINSDPFNKIDTISFGFAYANNRWMYIQNGKLVRNMKVADIALLFSKLAHHHSLKQEHMIQKVHNRKSNIQKDK